MAQRGEQKEQQMPNQGAPSQNNDMWGQSLKNAGKRKYDGSGMSSSQKKPEPRSYTWSRSRSPSPSRCKFSRNGRTSCRNPLVNINQTMSAGWGQPNGGQPMPGKREEQKQPNPSIRNNPILTRTQGVVSTNNDGSGMSPVQPDPHSSTTSGSTYPGHGRGGIRSVERSPGKERHHLRIADLSKKIQSRSKGTSPVATKKDNLPGLSSPHPELPVPDLSDRNKHDRWGRHSPATQSRPLSPWSQAAQDLNIGGKEKESEEWGPNSSWGGDRNNLTEPKRRLTGQYHRPSPKFGWSNNEQHLEKSRGREKNYNNNATDGSGNTHHHTIPDTWNQSRSHLSPDGGFDRISSGCDRRGTCVPNSNAYGPATWHPKGAQIDNKWRLPGVASSSMLILDAYQKTRQDGIVIKEAFSRDSQILSQNHGDVKGKAVMNTYAVHNAGPSQQNQNVIMTKGATTGTETNTVDNSSFKWALIGFATAKMRPLLLKQHFTNEMFMLILRKFVENVARSLGSHAPQTDEDSRVFIKEKDQSLSNFLDKTYLQRYVMRRL